MEGVNAPSAPRGPRIGVSERALAVLNALISFYPETTLTGEET